MSHFLQLSDVARLRPLKDLVSLSLSKNPLCDLAHYRLYAVFHLRTVGLLDRQQVTERERMEAEERFAQGKVMMVVVVVGELVGGGGGGGGSGVVVMIVMMVMMKKMMMIVFFESE